MDANKAVPTTVDSVTVLPVGVMGFNSAFWFGAMQYEKLFDGYTLASILSLIIFLFAIRQFMRGITSGALKG